MNEKDIRSEIKKILKYPVRSDIKISKKEVGILENKLNDMPENKVVSLREFLTAIPALSGNRCTIRVEEDSILTEINGKSPYAHIVKEYYNASDDQIVLDL